MAKKAKKELQAQIDGLVDQLSNLKSAGAGETKSSAGDKYETQREMIKQSQEMLNGQLLRTQSLLFQLNAIPTIAQNTVQEGALMQLSIGNIWISVSFGQIEHDDIIYQMISKDSPLFSALKNSKKGDSISFRGRKIVVEDLI